MKTSAQVWTAVYADPVLGEQGRHFFVDKNQYEQIVSTGLSVDFQESAFNALVYLSDRVSIVEDPYDVELSEDFELPHGPDEGLPERWYVEYQPGSDRYVVLYD